jgi:hypothetical protein
MISYLLNPARKHKKSRKAKRRKGVARRIARRARSISRKARRAGIKSRPYTIYSRPTLRYLKRAHRKANPSRRSRRSSRRKSNARGWYFKKSRGSRARRINPGRGLGSMLAPAANLLPFRIPVPGPGILSTVVNGTVQGVAIGAAAFVGYVGSGYLVDAIYPKAKVAANPAAWAKWVRPGLFAATAGLVGGLVAMLAPKGRKAAWALAASAGPGIRAASGLLANVISPASVGFMSGVRNVATGLADYLQVGEMYEAGLGEEEGVDDFLQVGEMYEAGLGEEEDEEAEVVS